MHISYLFLYSLWIPWLSWADTCLSRRKRGNANHYDAFLLYCIAVGLCFLNCVEAQAELQVRGRGVFGSQEGPACGVARRRQLALRDKERERGLLKATQSANNLWKDVRWRNEAKSVSERFPEIDELTIHVECREYFAARDHLIELHWVIALLFSSNKTFRFVHSELILNEICVNSFPPSLFPLSNSSTAAWDINQIKSVVLDLRIDFF